MRRAAAVCLLAASTLLLACPEEQDDGEAAAGLITEADSLRCASRATLYTNHTANPKDLHVRVKVNCVPTAPPVETIIPGPARLTVLDRQNQPVPGSDIRIPNYTTHRGTITVPGGGKLELDCSDHARSTGGCTWSYQYALP